MSEAVELNFTTIGEGDPLILIMGLGADGPVWEEHANEYQKHFKCYLIDNRGVGLSPKPQGSYTTDQMADDVAALMEKEGISSAPVAGISMGGAIAQSLALRHPEKVSRLVLIATWAKCSPYMKLVFEHFKPMRAHSKLEDFMMLLQLWIWGPKYVAENEDALQEARYDMKGVELPQPRQGFEGQCDACTNHDTTGRLDQIKVPTLITAGDKDIFTPIEGAEYLKEHIDGSKLVVFEDCAHTHHWEALERFNKVTTEFLLEGK
ncbi:alpha/beta fold hydrolase [Pelagicoccus mobilis]|uniref:Alpha/beta fold hydrolase n=1 Tax=Pelagicoccus mobilis TaxID=415221 RepID=A0A934VRN9_9BACT|nr:alpha/beta fold hydrolase [Pelagicoccus mobilis]MBK1878150.1 alpha/beta fold hydrolase [Pelagicoccus mobilis]